jgi:glycosyltransferase involved in cell wall biosynthesis
MRVALLTPGTGHYYCGSCLRDSALARGLAGLDQSVESVPLYLPFVLEEHGQEERLPVHMGGINMYLQHKLPLAARAPGWMRSLLDAPGLLRWAASRGSMTEPRQLGRLTVSMLRGEEGRQGRAIGELVDWLAGRELPDVVCLSNVMLVGIVRSLKRALGRPVVCSLQGEAPFLDALPEPHRSEAWAVLVERATQIDAFVPVSQHYGELMRERLRLPPERVHVVHNGIDPSDLATRPLDDQPAVPTLGYLARMCVDKGLLTLVEAYIALRKRGRVRSLRLRVAGAMLAVDRPLVEALRNRLEEQGLGADVEFLPNVERHQKVAFLRSLSVLSVPATYGESFGLYLLEAMAAGVPVVQPRHGAFPEILAATGGGLLCEPNDADSLADGIERLLLEPPLARELAGRGRRAVLERFSVERMARGFLEVCTRLAHR